MLVLNRIVWVSTGNEKGYSASHPAWVEAADRHTLFLPRGREGAFIERLLSPAGGRGQR